MISKLVTQESSAFRVRSIKVGMFSFSFRNENITDNSTALLFILDPIVLSSAKEIEQAAPPPPISLGMAESKQELSYAFNHWGS